MKNKSYVYILECSDGSYYTGITNNFKRRMEEHFYKKKQGAKYTKSHQAEKILMVWQTDSLKKAASVEYFIKKQTRKRKEEFIHKPENLAFLFYAYMENKQNKLKVPDEGEETLKYLEKVTKIGDFPIRIDIFLE